MCSIDPAHGRVWPPPASGSGWDNSATCGVGDSVLVDGAKRDRVIWPGDMGISSLTAIATTGDLDASRNSVKTLFGNQLPDGMLPYAGPPVSQFGLSDTYHLWALLGTYQVALHDASGGLAWLRQLWDPFQRAVAASTAKVSPTTGLFRVNAVADWQRHGQGGENSAANALYYGVLTAAAEAAGQLGNASLAASYRVASAAVRESFLRHLWDERVGAFVDNTNGSRMHPQDGNALALWLGLLANSSERAGRVSDYLQSNWGTYGAHSPEWDGNIGTFPGSMEVHAHFAARRPSRAHALIRRQWGYMLNHPQSTQSTFWEGYNADGTFNFSGRYMSNAHGWATGPAAALSRHTVGIRPLTIGGLTYAISPQFGKLTHCVGRLSFGRARHVDVMWNVSVGALVLALNASAHPDALGRIILDLSSLESPPHSLRHVMLNGVMVWSGGQALSRSALGGQGRHQDAPCSGSIVCGGGVNTRTHSDEGKPVVRVSPGGGGAVNAPIVTVTDVHSQQYVELVLAWVE